MTESVNNQQLSAADCDMRPALVDDIPAIVAIIETGRELLAAEGVDQWQNGAGPCPNAVASDILQGWGRVFTVCDEVAATAALMPAPDPAYAHIDGAWETRGEGSYAAIHRVAVSPEYRGRRVARRFIERLIEEARARGFSEVRIDTHEKNARMRKVIEGHGLLVGRHDLHRRRPERASLRLPAFPLRTRCGRAALAPRGLSSHGLLLMG